MVSGVIPPTGNIGTDCGITARQALVTSGVICSAGNSLMALAPCSMAAKASVGVATPGAQYIPSARARRITAVSQCGITIIWPPASLTATTCSTESTVPAPTRQSLGRASRSKLILCNASGEFIGISIRRNPAAYSFSPMATISSGFTPRKMATNPVFCKSVLNGMGTFPGVGGQ
ncbi:aldolase [Escherichia coli]|uniref:Aldolase n=1 Tax=Escherichia coli O1:K1 / APEC TaxID=405955 RepID=A0A0H2Z523_ECOK1|nr:putative aldolase [Escherichia coli APEC O1]AKK45033.1 aldolase [Escherichia coli]